MRIVVFLLLVVVFAPVPARAAPSPDDLGQARAAYESGDYAQALKAFTALAKKGDRDAQYHLGMMIGRGEGVEPDEEKHKCLIYAAADNGQADAQWRMYELIHGPGLDNALDWADRAAQQGQVQALFHVGRVYGWSPMPDGAKGYMYMYLAGLLGNEEAVDYFQPLLNSTKFPEIREKAVEGKRRAQSWRPEIEPIPKQPLIAPERCYP